MPWNSSRPPTWISHHPLLRIHLPQSPPSLVLPYQVHIPRDESAAGDRDIVSSRDHRELPLPSRALNPGQTFNHFCGPKPLPFQVPHSHGLYWVAHMEGWLSFVRTETQPPVTGLGVPVIASWSYHIAFPALCPAFDFPHQHKWFRQDRQTLHGCDDTLKTFLSGRHLQGTTMAGYVCVETVLSV